MSTPILSQTAAACLLAQRTNLMGAVTEAYLNSCRPDAKLIAEYVMEPEVCVDIGAGLGGVSVCLAKHWPKCKFIILDRDGYEGRKIDFGSGFGKYNSMTEAGRFLGAAGVSHGLCDIDKQPPPKKVDLAFSILSWGFHYPIAEHIDWVSKAADHLVIDCRVGTGAERELLRHYDRALLIRQAHKHEVYYCQRKQP